MAPRSSHNIMMPVTPSPSSSPNPPRSAPRPSLPHKAPLSTPRPGPGRKVEPASLYLPALRPSPDTPSPPPVERAISFSAMTPRKQEEILAAKINDTLGRLFEKVDGVLPESNGGVQVVSVNADAALPSPALIRRAKVTAVIEKVDTAFSDGDAKASSSSPPTSTMINPVPLAAIEEGDETPRVRAKTPVEEAHEIRRTSGFNCCPSSSPKKHTDDCKAVTRWPKENLTPNKVSAARTSSIKACNNENLSSKKRVDKLLREPWVCKAHKRSPPVQDMELYVCMCCTRNRVNKAGGGRRS